MKDWFVPINWRIWVVAVVTALVSVPAALAQQNSVYRNLFDAEPLTWKVESYAARQAIESHTLTDRHGREGIACEQILFASPAAVADQRLLVPIPPARVFEELRGSLWVRTNLPHVRIGLRVQFPHQIDPRSEEPLVLDYFCDAHTTPNQWQQLSISVQPTEWNRRLALLRDQISSGLNPISIDTREIYVDHIVLSYTLPQGRGGIQIDDLSLQPIVTPQRMIQSQQPEEIKRAPLTFAGDRVLKNDRPFFPVFTIYHGESLDDVAQTGVNMLWVPDYEDAPLLTALEQMHIGAIAQPPLMSTAADIQQTSAIQPFPASTSPVWAWMLGVDIPSERLPYVRQWIDQLKDADRAQRRPIFADVTGNERAFHRDVSFLGATDFVVHTDVEMWECYDRLRQRPTTALLGKPMFSFVATEPIGEFLDHRPPGAAVPIVEPETILLQAYAALAAGYKGIGFWKQIPFDESTTGLNERILAIRLFALHCYVLESWLATGRVADEVPVLIDGDEPVNLKNTAMRTLASRWDALASQGMGPSTEVRATKIGCDKGLLILPVWYGQGSQCVPGPRAAQGIRLFVRGNNEPQAWEVSATRVSQLNLELTRIAGGTEIHLREFDEQAAIVITRDQDAVNELLSRSREVSEAAAEASLQLTQLKLKRIQSIHEELVPLAPPVSHAEDYLKSAEVWTKRAEQELGVGHEHDSRIASQKARQQLRALQRRHWENANRALPSVTACLSATNFQTLPEHWRLMESISRQGNKAELIPVAGDFEDEQQFVTSGWFDATPAPGKANFQLKVGESGKHLVFSLSPGLQGSTSGLLLSPEFPVIAGDLLAITGQIQVPQAFDQLSNGLMIYEAYDREPRAQASERLTELTGNRAGAVRINDAHTAWKTFTLFREVPRDGYAHIRFELTTPGVVLLDNIQVHKIPR